jgi:hypothetical protein
LNPLEFNTEEFLLMVRLRFTSFLALMLLLALFIPKISFAKPPLQVSGPAAPLKVDTQTVEVMKLGTRQWLRPNNSTTMNTADRLRSNQSGTATVTWFEEGPILELAPNTELVVERFDGDEDEFIVEITIISGTVFIYLPEELSEESLYRIYTPTFQIDGKEGVYVVSVDAETFATSVATTVGNLEVLSDTDLEAPFSVDEGEMAILDYSGDIDTSFELDEADRDYEPFIEALTTFETKMVGEPEAEPTEEE